MLAWRRHHILSHRFLSRSQVSGPQIDWLNLLAVHVSAPVVPQQERQILLCPFYNTDRRTVKTEVFLCLVSGKHSSTECLCSWYQHMYGAWATCMNLSSICLHRLLAYCRLHGNACSLEKIYY